MDGQFLRGPRVSEVNGIRLSAPPVADVDSRDDYVAKLVAVGVGSGRAWMGRPKALDLWVKGIAVDDGPETECCPEQNSGRVSDQVDLGEPGRRSWPLGRSPGNPASRPDEQDPRRREHQPEADEDPAAEASAVRIRRARVVAGGDRDHAGQDHQDAGDDQKPTDDRAPAAASHTSGSLARSPPVSASRQRERRQATHGDDREHNRGQADAETPDHGADAGGDDRSAQHRSRKEP